MLNSSTSSMQSSTHTKTHTTHTTHSSSLYHLIIQGISTLISHLFLGLLQISIDEVVEGIVSTAFLHGINSDCSHTHKSTAHYICMYSGRGKSFMQQTTSQRSAVAQCSSAGCPQEACARLDVPQTFALGHLCFIQKNGQGGGGGKGTVHGSTPSRGVLGHAPTSNF